MRKSRKCPKCDSSQIGELKNAVVMARSTTEISFDGWLRVGAEGFVCGNCGFFETYITAPVSSLEQADVSFTWLDKDGRPRGPYR